MQNELLTQQLNVLLSKEVLDDKWVQAIEALIKENRALRHLVDIALECDLADAFLYDIEEDECKQYEEESYKMNFIDWLIFITEKHLEKEDEK